MNHRIAALITALLLLFPFSRVFSADKNNFCKTYLSNTRHYAEIMKAEKYAAEKNRLLKSIAMWEKFAGRGTTQTEFIGSRAIGELIESLTHKNAYNVANHFRSRIHDVQFNVFRLKHYEEFRSHTAALLSHMKNSPAEFKGMKLKELLIRVAPDENMIKAIHRHEKFTHEEAVSLLEHFTEVYQEKIFSHSRKIIQKIDEYGAIMSYLEKFSQVNHDKQEKVKQVLESFNSSRVLKSYIREAKLTDVKTPTVSEIQDLVYKYQGMSFYRLKLIRRREIVAAALSISPTQTIFKYLAAVIERIPGIRKNSVKNLLGVLQTMREKQLYYPAIQEVAMSKAKPSERLLHLQTLNATTEDELLVTFARRIDLKKDWDELKSVAKTENEQFFSRMENAESLAAKLDELTLTGNDDTKLFIKRAIDLAAASYLGYKFVGVLNDDETDDVAAEDKTDEILDTAAQNED